MAELTKKGDIDFGKSMMNVKGWIAAKF